MRERILVIDENREIASLISEDILGPRGYQIIVVQDQDQGQQEIDLEGHDLILLGLEAPHLDALAVLDKLEADQHEMPVILMISDCRDKLPATVFHRGVRDCVSRPADAENLLRAVDSALTETRLRREMRQLADDLAVARRKLDRQETERTRVLGHAEDEHRALESILSSMEDLIVVTDEWDRIVVMNSSARRVFGVGDGRVKGRPLPDVLKNEDVLGLHQQPFNVVRGNQKEISLAGGQELLATMSPIPALGRAIVMKDITYLKQSDQLKSDSIRAISHDMRSPLTSVRGFVDLLTVVGDLNQKQHSFLDKINSAIDGIVALVDDLLYVDQLEAPVDWGAEPCDLNEIISTVVERFLERARRKKQDLAVETTPAPLLVQAVSFRLEQVVNSLVTGAVEHTPAGGSIHISSHVDGDFAVVSLQADRLGIALSQHSPVLDEFGRQEGKSAQHTEVSGSTLSANDLICEEADGRLRVKIKPNGVIGLSVLFRRLPGTD